MNTPHNIPAKPSGIEQLLDIMRRLRDPEDGCPWDVKQTHETIVPYTIEEAYEVAEAVARRKPEEICDELGDLLLQVIFQARIAEENGDFTFADVVDAISAKMIRRHPHVFVASENPTPPDALPDVLPDAPTNVNESWEALKEKERHGQGARRLLDNIASSLPPMTKALKMQKRAARVGFDWSDIGSVFDKLSEETQELLDEVEHQPADPNKIKAEVGDMLFVMVNLARKLNIDPEQALAETNRKFIHRFSHIENSAIAKGLTLDDVSLDQMEEWWQDAKRNPRA